MRAALLALLIAASLRAAERKPLVLIFTRTDCPIANRYAPELQRLFNSYSSRVDFRLIYIEPGITAENMQKHRSEFGLGMPASIDADRKYVRLGRATVTPEAAVFVEDKLVYRGRIDDRYVSFGVVRREPQHHDLADVLAEVAAGKVPQFRATKAIGCAIEP
jgi:hypothetical protein